MVLDVVCEQIVQKKFEGKEMLKMYGIGILVLTLGAVLIAVIAAMMKAGSALLPLMALLLVGVIVLAVYLFRSLFVEYEYDLINGDLAIDKIVSQSNRSNLMNIDLTKVEKFFRYDFEKFNKDEYESVFCYSYSDRPDDAVVLVFPDEEYGRTALIMSPDEKMMEGLKKCINRMVVREGFPA